MKKMIPLLLILSIFSFSSAGCSGKNVSAQSNTSTSATSNEKVEEKDNSYSGTMKAINETKVIPKAKGQIEECFYNVNDKVNAGDLLFQIDDNGLSDTLSTTKNSISRADIAITTANDNLSNLRVYAPASGILHNFTLKVGDRINTNKIADVVDEQSLIAKVPFNEGQLGKISVGNSASLMSSDFMTSTTGTVTRIYDSRETTIGGSVLHNVEITAYNPGGFKTGSQINAVISTDSGDIYSPVSGKIEDGESLPVVSRGSGNVKSVYVKNGQKVSEGQLLLEIDNINVNATLQRANLDRNDLDIKLRSLEQDIADLKITAPSSGKITAKSKNKLDNITSNSESIMTISDTSSLILSINVNEDDAAKLKVGDYIDVKIDDENSSKVQGKITSVSTGKIVGGSKIFPVEITIDNKNDLYLPNTTASITLGGNDNEKKNN
jgi:Membrane-fusion protein